MKTGFFEVLRTLLTSDALDLLLMTPDLHIVFIHIWCLLTSLINIKSWHKVASIWIWDVSVDPQLPSDEKTTLIFAESFLQLQTPL